MLPSQGSHWADIILKRSNYLQITITTLRHFLQVLSLGTDQHTHLYTLDRIIFWLTVQTISPIISHTIKQLHPLLHRSNSLPVIMQPSRNDRFTYMSSGQTSGRSSRPPSVTNFSTSMFVLAGYGCCPNVNTSQTNTPNALRQKSYNMSTQNITSILMQRTKQKLKHSLIK